MSADEPDDPTADLSSVWVCVGYGTTTEYERVPVDLTGERTHGAVIQLDDDRYVWVQTCTRDQLPVLLPYCRPPDVSDQLH